LPERDLPVSAWYRVHDQASANIDSRGLDAGSKTSPRRHPSTRRDECTSIKVPKGWQRRDRRRRRRWRRADRRNLSDAQDSDRPLWMDWDDGELVEKPCTPIAAYDV
jgi:hypothetical protein